ncbi:hypothetical protein BDR06DRAFT_568449 [Suillus hirtellus]|nr:hypothetical protein BDR06DRAFT_568449 [Suillus hirtellus]
MSTETVILLCTPVKTLLPPCPRSPCTCNQMKMLETERRKYSFVYPVRKLASRTRLAIEKLGARW